MDPGSPRLRHVPNYHFEIFDILDPAGRTSDQVWIQNGLVFDWNQYKLLADTKVGALVLHQRFEPQFPLGNSYPHILLDPMSGESGARLESIPAGLTRERLHFIYVFDGAGILEAAYDAKGDLERIAGHDNGGGSIFTAAAKGMDNEFAACKFPLRITGDAVKPPLNEVIRSGIGTITTSKLSSLPLIDVFVVEQFMTGRVCSVRVRHRRQGGQINCPAIRPATL